MMSSQIAHAATPNAEHGPYPDFLCSLQRTFDAQTGSTMVHLFTTENDHRLFSEIFLPALPSADRQFYTCHACMNFMKRYGGLVTINRGGAISPVIWGSEFGYFQPTPDYFKPAVAALCTVVSRARVTGVFVTAETTWGVPRTGVWTHMAVVPPAALIYGGDQYKTPLQITAEKSEDMETLTRALNEYPAKMLVTAVNLLQTDALFRSEKVLGMAVWLKTLSEQLDRTQHAELRRNLLWRAVATAPSGFCHPRASMIGTLLDDISNGMTFPQIERRFRLKMDATRYQRPQVAPTAQNIARAEAIVAELGIAESLKRRYARLDEIETIWRPKSSPAASGQGVFGKLVPKTPPRVASTLDLPTINMTVEKFRRTMMPTADTIEIYAPVKGNFIALVTAQDSAAPPILQWDQPDRRNPVSAYVYQGLSSAISWNLTPSQFHRVTALALVPSMWHGRDIGHIPSGLIASIDGARDSNWFEVGIALFPEILKTELREVRATIEAYSKQSHFTGYAESSACDLLLTAGAEPLPLLLRVTTAGVVMNVRLDRWD